MTRIYYLLLFILFIYSSETKKANRDKELFCKEVKDCQPYSGGKVCGVRWDGERFHLKIFSDECELLQYGCSVEEKDEYGIINMKYCSKTALEEHKDDITVPKRNCIENCPSQLGNETVCGITEHGGGFKVRLFVNECEMKKYNCNYNDTFHPTDHFVCNGLDLPENGSPKEFDDCIYDCPAQVGNETICGIRKIGKGFKARLFVNECEMMKYNCKYNFEFNITDDFICHCLDFVEETTKKECLKSCTSQPNETICGIRQQGQGFKVRLFGNECEMIKYNCENKLTFNRTDHFACDGLVIPKKSPYRRPPAPQRRKNVVIVDADMFDNTGDINETIDNFFSGTHLFDMPVQDVSHRINATTRRVLINLFGPVVVFKPWVHIPKVRKNDTWHLPLINSCFHKCPTECPDVYAPVCGSPGKVAREPHIMFQNHCVMDAAQCKMKWEDASPTAETSAYIETTFVFCLGMKLYGLYRFLPLVRTLQHMGRLKKKGQFHMRLRNQRFFNEHLPDRPRLMG